MASYPGAIPAKPSIVTADMSAVTTHTTDRGALWDELIAMANELGLTPSGSASTVAARFDHPAQTWSSPVSSGITLGNGVPTANYVQVGDLCVATYKLLLGATSNVIATPVFDLPVNALIANCVAVSGYYLDDSAGAKYPAQPHSSSSTQVSVAAANAAGTYLAVANLTTTVPFDWASLDEINLTFTWIAA